MSKAIGARSLALVCLALLGAFGGCSTSDAVSDAPDGGDSDGATPVNPGPPCGRNTTLCKEGEKCEGALDCETKNCRDNVCKSISPANGVKDGDETDIDCGGKSAPACGDGKGCLVKDDCTSGVCTGGICQAPSPNDGIKNGDETDVDCGGSKAPKCGVGKGCKSDNDCNAVKCDPVKKTCSPPSYTDGIKNGDETDVDCGGGAPTKCAVGKGCKVTADCDKVLCDTGATNKCLPPAPDDGIKNGTETDIDCGGGPPTNAPKCALGKSCLANSDCSAKACNYAKKCIDAVSCVVHEGGDTCGKGEVGQAGAAHESCCASVLLPSGTARIDKYEITSGRVREFISRVGNNVQAWVSANRAITQDIPDSMVPYLPTGLSTPTRTVLECNQPDAACDPNNAAHFSTVNRGFGVYDYLGNTVFMPDRPCPSCGQGCWVGSGDGQYGHPTYWWPAGTQSVQWGAAARSFTQAELDVKSLNCVPQVLLAAFCAWDGGRLPTTEELGGVTGAWGPMSYPWGATNPQDTMPGAPNRTAYPWSTSDFSEPAYASGAYNYANAIQYNVTNWNPFPKSPALPTVRYVWPQIALANWDQKDTAYAVAAPGRMVNDFRFVGPGATDGYFDVGGNVMEATSTIVGNDNANHNSWPVVQWVGGSFEGHGVNNRGGYNLSVLTKYGKQGGRCARPAL